MLCSNCGTKLKADDKECPKCHRFVSFEQIVSAKTKSEPNEIYEIETIEDVIEDVAIEESKATPISKEKPKKIKRERTKNANPNQNKIFWIIMIILLVFIGIGLWYLFFFDATSAPKNDPPKIEEEPKKEEEKPKEEPVDDKTITFGNYTIPKIDRVTYEVVDNQIHYAIDQDKQVIIQVVEATLSNQVEVETYINQNLLPQGVLGFGYKEISYQEQPVYLYNILTSNSKVNYIIKRLDDTHYIIGMITYQGSFSANRFVEVNQLPEELKNLYDEIFSVKIKESAIQ